MSKVSLARVSLAVLLLGCSGKLNVGDKGSGGDIGYTGGRFGGGGAITPQGGNTGDGGVSTAGLGGSPDEAYGAPGRPCIQGGVVLEAQATPAQAEVQIPSRCVEGYSCNAENVCVPREVCHGPRGAECVVFTSTAGGKAGTGTGGRTGTGGFSTGGTTSQPTISEQRAITGISADEANVYWIGYGSRDALGNFNDDGTLRAWSLADGTMATLATELPGPVGLGITNSHAYILVDGALLIGSVAHLQILRVPLSGGKPELIQDAEVDPRWWGDFVTSAARAFWAGSERLYSMATDDTKASVFAPSPVLSDVAFAAAADETHLYYSTSYLTGQAPVLRRTPISGGPGEDVTSPVRPIALRDGFVYSVEDIDNGTGRILVRATASGGNWVRVRALGAGNGSISHFQLAGNRYFFDGFTSSRAESTASVVTAALDSDAPAIRIVEVDPLERLMWVGTADAIFWTDGSSVYTRTLE